MNGRDPVIETRGLTKHYGEQVGLAGLDLRIEPGEVVGLLGPNGAGKTTAIRMLLGLMTPTSGTVLLFGREPRDPAARLHVGYLPSDPALDLRLTGEGMLDLLADLRPKDAPPVDPAVRDGLCERLGVTATDRRRLLREDSRGTRQKLALVGTWQHEPELLILDEPTSGLDPLVRQAVFELMRDQGRLGRTVLHSSHILGEVDRTCDRVVILRDGQLAAEGRVEELRADLPRRLTLRFAAAPPTAELEGAGATLVAVDGSRVELLAPGALGPLLAVLAAHEVLDLRAPAPDLAEVFHVHYGDVAGGRR